jgi:hypothetical protein
MHFIIYLDFHVLTIFWICSSYLSANGFKSRDRKRPPMIRAAMVMDRIAKLGVS